MVASVYPQENRNISYYNNGNGDESSREEEEMMQPATKVDVDNQLALHPSSDQHNDHNDNNVNQHNHSIVVTILSPSREDRSGTAVLDILKAHAYVWSLAQEEQEGQEQHRQHITFRYGGSCGASKHANSYVHLIRTLGLQDELPYNPLQCPPPHFLRHQEYDRISTTGNHPVLILSNNTNVRNILFNMTQSATLLLHRQEYDIWDHVINPNWLQHVQKLRQQNNVDNIAPAPTKPHLRNNQNSQPQHVVIHMRRGDVSPCYTYRYLPNSYYLSLLDVYAPFMNSSTSARVTIFTEFPDDPRLDEGLQAFVGRGMALVTCDPNHTDSTVRQETNQNIDTQYAWMCHHNPSEVSSTREVTPPPPQHVILVNADMEVVWDTILQSADVVIMSKSLFSCVPALFSKAHTVVYHRFFFEPLRTWRRVPRRMTMASNVEMRRVKRQYCG